MSSSANLQRQAQLSRSDRALLLERVKSLKARATGGGLTLAERQALRRVARNPRRNADGTDAGPWIDQLPAMQGEPLLDGSTAEEPRRASDYAAASAAFFANPNPFGEYIDQHPSNYAFIRGRRGRRRGRARPKKQASKKRAKKRKTQHAKSGKRCTCGAKSGRVIQLNL